MEWKSGGSLLESSPVHAIQVNNYVEWERQSFVGKVVLREGESRTVALRKFQLQKNVKTRKRSLIVAGLTKYLQRFEGTGLLQDRVRSGRPDLRQARCSQNETLASESAAGTSNAREAGRRLGLPPSSIRNLLHGVLNQYPYKLRLAMNFYHRIP
ncbi:DUF4817 domain-containing protein [Nephila pilipes]|uniref:DUF4817 domain-containing protein n=1 Tax=Nephila pilipes TaxID=299642 RepID=A0A8X6NZV8_NEPPI|nr:DUF4817 domain-containing protein [Nephila pilipes]